MLREEYWPDDSRLYFDDNHLNSYGAEKFTTVLCKYLNGELNDDIFYDSISQKLGNISCSFYGLKYNDDISSDCIAYQIIVNRPDEIETRVYINGGEVIKDWNNDVIFHISKDYKDDFIVEFKRIGENNSSSYSFQL